MTRPVDVREVVFTCRGTATGKMRNELEVAMTAPMEEHFTLATDEGAFHGGDATAPPPLALFVGALTGCLMTPIRAFAKRLRIPIADLRVETRAVWEWRAVAPVYETAPRGFEIDVFIDSDAPVARLRELVAAAKKGCFVEQTLGRANTVRHRIRDGDDWIEA